MPTEVIDLLAGMSVERAIFLAVGTSALFAVPYLAFVNVDRIIPQRVRDAHLGERAAVQAEKAWEHAAKAVLLTRVGLVAVLQVAVAYLTPADSASKKGAHR